MMFQSYFTEYRSEFIKALQTLDFTVIEQIFESIKSTRENNQQIFVIGNGGSAASASHWACDFGKGVNVEGVERFRILSLTDNLPFISALGNDMSYGDIFVEQLKNYLKPGDVVIGLSVSGNSENVVRAFQYAKKTGAKVISLVGEKEGRMKELSDISLVIPSSDYGIVEDVHMYVNHVISQYIKKENELKGALSING
ncbi:SIS domain-containing protein [Lederbergia citrea]|uniref:SIS domain-containing protein n=1 Tax=Lederbergia citrea TaxID=2833581 RepID=A0A942Z509_9BACI|nr:SIS domain-containing protein [Lederbergia citrea]MBS4205196.1 SIS domain-containing protein [Lederbergia citrea]MBS4222942.1 SIS domain-containing protein [Lederbergia citrea]